MTKFEEEVKRPKKAYIDPFSKRDVDFTGVAKKFTEGAQTLKEWKEYAFLLEDKLKLQQQALPVVPECVGSFLTDKSIFKIANGDIPDDVISWVQEQTYYVDLEKIISHLISLKVTGFKVEKPQLFYLKNKLTGAYLYYDEAYGEATNLYSDIFGNVEDFFGTKTKFTQQEIGSMQTGSYEQIEVTE